VRILKTLQADLVEVWKIKDLQADEIGQNRAKHGVCPQVLILKDLTERNSIPPALMRKAGHSRQDSGLARFVGLSAPQNRPERKRRFARGDSREMHADACLETQRRRAASKTKNASKMLALPGYSRTFSR
jgi:hypothetical protein